MDLHDQIFTAVDANDFAALDSLLSALTSNRYHTLFAIQHACDQQNLDAVRHILPYATQFFFEGKGPRDPNVIGTMDLSPYDTFFELLHDRVIPTNNLELFTLFVPLMLHNINSAECAGVLIDCYESDQLELIDCVLPFMDDLSGFHGPYASHIGEFFEQRKAQYQHDTITQQVDKYTKSSNAQRKM